MASLTDIFANESPPVLAGGGGEEVQLPKLVDVSTNFVVSIYSKFNNKENKITVNIRELFRILKKEINCIEIFRCCTGYKPSSATPSDIVMELVHKSLDIDDVAGYVLIDIKNIESFSSDDDFKFFKYDYKKRLFTKLTDEEHHVFRKHCMGLEALRLKIRQTQEQLKDELESTPLIIRDILED